MTANQLHKDLGKLIAAGKGRYKITVEKDTFRHPISEVSHHDVEAVETMWIPLCDDDGGTAINKDGSERGFSTVVLKGGRES